MLPIAIIASIIVGTVFHAESGEPIEGANIYYQGTNIGTASDAQGSFILQDEMSKQATLVISAIGYKTQRYKIEPETSAGIEVAMQEKADLLGQVTIVPSDDEVKMLIRKVKERREDNDRFLHSTSTIATEKTFLSISHLPSRFAARHLGDSAAFLPLYREQKTVALEAAKTKDISAPEQHAIVLSETDYSALIHRNGNLNFYQPNVYLLGHSFISPLAKSSTLYYRYYLADSVVVDGAKQYVIHFRAKNSFDPAFNGSMYIDSATYALCAIEAHVPPHTNINGLAALRVSQTLATDHTLLMEQMHATIDYLTVIRDSTRQFPTIEIQHELQAVQSEVLTKQPVADSLSKSAWMDSLVNIPILKVATFFARVGTTGYIPTGSYVDFGHIAQILQVNEHETVHVGLPLATSPKLMKNIRLEASIGYGVRDRAWKGMGRASFNLPTPRRHVLQVEYHDQYVYSEVDEMTYSLRENAVGQLGMDFTAYAFEALYANQNHANSAVRQRQGSFRWEADWNDILETTIYLKAGTQGYGSPLVGYHQMPFYSYSTIGALFRLGWQERRIDGWFRRIHRGGKYPTLFIGIEGGAWNEPDDTRFALYGKFNLLLKQNLSLGMAGELDYAFGAGIMMGTLPPQQSYNFQGNQGYTFDPYRFTLMNNLQYTSQRYMTLHLNWNGQGILFNHIPGIRYLHLRELAIFKLAYGDGLTIPYVEIGCGIGNILRVGELYSVWRLTHRSDLTTPLWSLRFRIHLSL